MNAAGVVLVDDHYALRTGLRTLIEGFAGIAVLGEAENGVAALELVARLHPDVVITDIKMKEMNGLELTCRLTQEHPEVKVVVLSMYPEERYVQEALAAGASAYLLKDSAMLELELALRAVLRGEMYLSPGVSKQVVDGAEAGGGSLQPMSPRQREVLKLIAEGASIKEVAYELGISAKTVETYRSQLKERLGVKGVAGLVKYAIRTGLVEAK